MNLRAIFDKNECVLSCVSDRRLALAWNGRERPPQGFLYGGGGAGGGGDD
jgi:hypothetical protein